MTHAEIPFARPWIEDEDRAAVMRVLGGHILTHGPECKSFEAAFAAMMGAPSGSCVSVSSCMAALHLSYLHLGIGPGDEVIVPAQTHVATVHAVEWVGATPVFVDCESETGNMHASAIAAAITSRTRAISVVHFAGIPCDMESIMSVAREHELFVIEDCATAVGARWNGTHVGLFGDTGCFSFYPVKHLTTGEGGMFVSARAGVPESVARLRAFGVDRSHQERSLPGLYDVPSLGLNYRMSEMQAALGLSQLRRAREMLDRRAENFAEMRHGLADVLELKLLDAKSEHGKSSHYCLVAVLLGRSASRRNELVTLLNQQGVGTSIYYPQPVPRMKFYREKYGYDPSMYPNASAISDCGFALPVGPHVKLSDIRYIVNSVREILRGWG